MKDSFYTPRKLALTMVKYVDKRNIDLIADFTAGDGELLRAGETIWPNAGIVAVDIDPSVVKALRRRHPKWHVKCRDFLGDNISAKEPFSYLLKNVSVILMNPPFSNRGGKRFTTYFGDAEIKCSQGMAFLSQALPFLSDQGELITILPAGSIDNEMDAIIWKSIRKQFQIDILCDFHDRTFYNCLPRTKMVRLSNRRPQQKMRLNIETGVRKSGIAIDELNVTIQRGKVDVVHEQTLATHSDAYHLVHTTELLNGEVITGKRFTSNHKALVTGPNILLPRVGRPNVNKICQIQQNISVALSTCVLAVSCENENDSHEVYRRITENWLLFSRIYGGTCAYYTTLRKLRAALSMLSVEVVDALGAEGVTMKHVIGNCVLDSYNTLARSSEEPEFPRAT